MKNKKICIHKICAFKTQTGIMQIINAHNTNKNNNNNNTVVAPCEVACGKRGL